MMAHLAQILLLLGVAVAVVVMFQRLHVPTSLGYLLVGVILGPHTIGPTVYVPEFNTLAEFGLVFLLFTIGLNFSLPQLHALRHQVLGLGTGQVMFTTAVVGLAAWLAGMPAAAAFVVGAVFAQSSTAIIGSQLAEQGEENSPHGRLGLAMSVFQDVTAVPFLVVIPVLGMAVGADVLGADLGWALAKAVAAFALLLLAGRWLLRPLFHLVTRKRSAEVLTLTVLLVVLLAAWFTSSLGLSLAFGAFLAGMMLGDTEFRHQVEASIRPFRDVLLGLFFIGIGMLFDPVAVAPTWHWAVLGASLILVSKTLLVFAMVHRSGIDALVAWRTALLIRFNGVIAAWLVGAKRGEDRGLPEALSSSIDKQVVIGGYGRVGHTIAVLLHSSAIPFIALDTDSKRVAHGRAAGHPVSYGDISDPGLLAAIHVERASLVVIALDQSSTALRAISHLRHFCPHVPVIARARDLEASSQLLDAGAVRAYPEAIEASLRLGATALRMLDVPADDIDLMVQGVQDWDYGPVLEREPDK